MILKATVIVSDDDNNDDENISNSFSTDNFWINELTAIYTVYLLYYQKKLIKSSLGLANT